MEKNLERKKEFAREIVIGRLTAYRDRELELLRKWRDVVSEAEAKKVLVGPDDLSKFNRPVDIREDIARHERIRDGKEIMTNLEKSLTQIENAIERVRKETDKDPIKLVEDIHRSTDNGWIGNCSFKRFLDEEIEDAIRILEFEAKGGIGE